MMRYKYLEKTGALQEAMATEQVQPLKRRSMSFSQDDSDHNDSDHDLAQETQMLPQARPSVFDNAAPSVHAQAAGLVAAPAPVESTSLDPMTTAGAASMFYYTIEDGQRVLQINKNGTMEIVVGPKRVWRPGHKFKRMQHHVAHPGEFLIVRFRSGDQEHLAGPADVWQDPRQHVSVSKEDALQIGAKEAIIVYCKNDDDNVTRRIVHGPANFVPKPGEWLHTFSWHGSSGGRKVPNGLVFQKLWLMPDQMYHDVTDVRTADDAVLTIRLMLFFELVDIEKMLDASHDPIGDFINAAASDVVEFIGRHDFEAFKQNTDKMNQLETYKQLNSRAEQSGYRMNKVVYRGYGAPKSLQDMHDQAIESRTRLQLEKATERQAQELEDYKLDRDLERASKQRKQRAADVAAELELQLQKQKANLQVSQQQRTFSREQALADAEQEQQISSKQKAQQREYYAELSKLGVDLTRLLTQGRADQVIELRGDHQDNTHLHLPQPEHTSKLPPSR